METAKKTAERQREFRARHSAEGRTEVRGIYARREDHARIKAYAASGYALADVPATLDPCEAIAPPAS
jgi:hypothetical protein